MSRKQTHEMHDRSSFPRASGDEPIDPDTGEAYLVFSPRERG